MNILNMKKDCGSVESGMVDVQKLDFIMTQTTVVRKTWNDCEG